MRALPLTLLVIASSACGGAPPVSPEAAQARCAALLPQLGDGCRGIDLTGGDHTQLESEHVFEVDVAFREKGNVEPFTGLKRVGRGGEAPECLVERLRALRLPAGAAAALPLRIRYVPEPDGGAYASALADGGCALTLQPAP